MITRPVIFGGTGDLTGRYLLPGLAALRTGGYLDDGFELLCADLVDWDDRRFRSRALRPVPSMPFGHDGGTAPNMLRFGLDPESLTLALTAVGASVDTLAPLEEYPAGSLGPAETDRTR
ncbi:hypothetical protein [Nocardia sp. NPDC024068]|uniref:hypothetical protein n=1 Tax=Nocardia sp. NPDC024068 TaxID=3157197 RepID=UPI0033EC78BC